MKLLKSIIGIPICLCLAIGKIDSNPDDIPCIQACLSPKAGNNAATCTACVKHVQLTDLICARACSADFNALCDRCKDLPPITGEMCIYACDDMQSFWTAKICLRCKQIPPPSSKLCRHACLNTNNYYYHRICSLCHYMIVYDD